jgi:hypothetical protein
MDEPAFLLEPWMAIPFVGALAAAGVAAIVFGVPPDAPLAGLAIALGLGVAFAAAAATVFATAAIALGREIPAWRAAVAAAPFGLAIAAAVLLQLGRLLHPGTLAVALALAAVCAYLLLPARLAEPDAVE